jgi:hypothetical protein
MGKLGAVRLARVDGSGSADAPDWGRWARPSRYWASVTPVALPRNPGDLTSCDPHKRNAASRRAEAPREACARCHCDCGSGRDARCHPAGSPWPRESAAARGRRLGVS